MIKSRIMLVLVAALILVGMLAMAIPGAASAAVQPTDAAWQNPTYYAYDDYYGQWVYAYTEGATATAPVFIYNYPGGYYGSGDATIKSAMLKTDWGLQVAATGVPAVLAMNSGATIQFSFTVPSTAVATNAWTHSYEVRIEYQIQGVQYKVNGVPWQYLGSGNGINVNFGTGNSPVLPDSDKLFLVNMGTGAVEAVASSAYTLNDANGQIVFNTAPLSGFNVYTSYTYMEYEGNGDATQTVFWLNTSPIAPDSEFIYQRNSISGNLTLVPRTDYTLDDQSGRIVFNTAPGAFESVYASYDVYESSTWYTTFSGDDFVVLSADQAAFNTLEEQYNVLEDWYSWYGFNSAEGRALAAEADANDELAYNAWVAGNWAAARSFEQTAVGKLIAAKDAEIVYDKVWQAQDLASDNASIAEMLANAAENNGYAAYYNGLASTSDEQAALLAAQTDQIKALTDAQKSLTKANATKAKGYGTFLILLGVGVLLVGVAVLVLAVSRLMVARKPQTN